MADKLLDLTRLLTGTQFENKLPCLIEIFANSGITRIEQVDDLPAMGHICSCDVYQLVETIRVQYYLPVRQPVRRSKSND